MEHIERTYPQLSLLLDAYQLAGDQRVAVAESYAVFRRFHAQFVTSIAAQMLPDLRHDAAAGGASCSWAETGTASRPPHARSTPNSCHPVSRSRAVAGRGGGGRPRPRDPSWVAVPRDRGIPLCPGTRGARGRSGFLPPPDRLPPGRRRPGWAGRQFRDRGRQQFQRHRAGAAQRDVSGDGLPGPVRVLRSRAVRPEPSDQTGLLRALVRRANQRGARLLVPRTTPRSGTDLRQPGTDQHPRRHPARPTGHPRRPVPPGTGTGPPTR